MGVAFISSVEYASGENLRHCSLVASFLFQRNISLNFSGAIHLRPWQSLRIYERQP